MFTPGYIPHKNSIFIFIGGILLVFLSAKPINVSLSPAELWQTAPFCTFVPSWQMFQVSVSLAKLYLLLCFRGQCTCKLGTLTLFETRSAFECFENTHKGSYCENSFNQAHTAQLAFKLMTLLCICSIDLLSTKLKKNPKTVCQMLLNAAPTTSVKLCVLLCSIR